MSKDVGISVGRVACLQSVKLRFIYFCKILKTTRQKVTWNSIFEQMRRNYLKSNHLKYSCGSVCFNYRNLSCLSFAFSCNTFIQTMFLI